MGGGQHHRPAALPRGKDAVPIWTGGWVGSMAGLGGCGKSRSPPGFDPLNIQPVASRYTDCAIPAAQRLKGMQKINLCECVCVCV